MSERAEVRRSRSGRRFLAGPRLVNVGDADELGARDPANVASTTVSVTQPE